MCLSAVCRTLDRDGGIAMADVIELTLPVPYRERVRTRSRTFVERTAFADVALTVPLLPVWDLMARDFRLRVVASAKLRVGEEIKWVDNGDGPIRPLLVARPATGGHGGTAYGLAETVWWERDYLPRPESWPDYPFPGWVANDPEAARVRGEVVWNDLAERIEAARAIAGTMMYGHGRLYKRAPLPVWTVEDLRGEVPDMTRISLILPDLDEAVAGGRQPRIRPALGLFGPREAEAALRVSENLFGTDATILVGNRRRKVRDQVLTEYAYLKEAVDPLPVEAAGTLRLCRRIVAEMSERDAWEMGGDGFEAAVAGFEAAASTLSAAVGGGGGPEGLTVALDGLAEAAERAADVLSREVGTDAEALFLFRAVAATREARTPVVRPKPPWEDLRSGRYMGF